MSAAADLVVVRNALRSARKRLATQQQRHWGLTPRMLRVAVRIFLLSGLDRNCVVRFVDMVRKRRGCPDALAAGMVAEEVPIGELHAAWPDVAGLLAPATPAAMRELQEARVFLAKVYTCEWICRQNFDHGVAPEMRPVLQHYNQQRLACDLPASLALTQALNATEGGKLRLGRYGRKWAQRFRKCFGMRRKRLPAKHRPSLEELLLRAPCSSRFSHVCCFLRKREKSSFCGASFVPLFDTNFGVALL